MKRKTKYLDFYKKCMKTGRIPSVDTRLTINGLCSCLGKDAMDLFTPTWWDCIRYQVSEDGYWAADQPNSGVLNELGFGPTRQTIVLFLAAMNNEL